MGLMDAFTADARVELKVGDLYEVLRVSASNEKTAQFLKNAVKCEIPYNYIREMITGEKEDHKEAVRIEIPRGLIEKAFTASKEAAEAIAAEMAAGQQGQEEPDEGLKDCAPEGVACEDCPSKIFCEEKAEAAAIEAQAAALAAEAAAMAAVEEMNDGQQGGNLPFDTEESEGWQE